MRRTLAAATFVTAMALATACSGGDDDQGADAPSTEAASPPPATGTTGTDEFCPGFEEDFAQAATTYDAALQDVNEAFQSGDQATVDQAVTELENHAGALSQLFRDGAGGVANAEFSAALQQSASELDQHVAAIAELDIADYGDPEATPDGVAFQEAVRDAVAYCE